MKQRLFVYGTLGPGRPNEHILTSIGGTWEEASVKGRLKPQGWGAEMGYPGIVLDESGDVISGFIFCSENLDNEWHTLDEFEGDEYQRVQIPVTTKDNRTVKAFIYVLKEDDTSSDEG